MFQPELLISSLNSYRVQFLVGENGEIVSAPLHPRELLAGLSLQADARMRLALIAVLLQRPEFSLEASGVLNILPNAHQSIFKLYFTAACYLQSKYYEQLEELLGIFQKIPDLYSEQLNLTPIESIEKNLQKLAIRHKEITDLDVNWYGTYQHVAKRVITRLRREREWAKV
jgi:hypothetical protein